MEYDKEELYDANLYSLRNIARQVGVHAPTHLKKKDLINEIMAIVNGEKPPCPPTTKGRPIKHDLAYTVPEPVVAEKENAVEKERLLRKQIKQEMISAILKQLEKKLNKLL